MQIKDPILPFALKLSAIYLLKATTKLFIYLFFFFLYFFRHLYVFISMHWKLLVRSDTLSMKLFLTMLERNIRSDVSRLFGWFCIESFMQPRSGTKKYV